LGAFEESRIISEFTILVNDIKFGEKATLYIFKQGYNKIGGYIAISTDTIILLYTLEGELLKALKYAHETSIVGLKFVEGLNKEIYLISCSRDGKFHIWNTEKLVN